MGGGSSYRRLTFHAGDLILHEGQPGVEAYLIESGSVEIFKTVGGEEIALSTLYVGEFFGETALIFDENRSASVRAKADCKLIVLDRSIFHMKLKRSDQTVRAIVQMLSRRVLQANESLIEGQRNLNSLLQATRIVYDNVADDLPAIKKRVFEEGIRPKFEEFVKAVEDLEYQINSTEDEQEAELEPVD